MRNLALLPILLFLTACAAVGLNQPQTVEQRLAYANGVYTAAVNSAASAVRAKVITPDDGKQVQALAGTARALLDGARSADLVKDTPTANAKLLLATQILDQLTVYLQARGVK